MKLNIANPGAGAQKTIEIDDDKKLLPFFEKRMAAEVPGDSLGDEFKGYVFKITGGNDKQGFPMMQGVLTNSRVRLLFTKGMKCYRPRRDGEKKRKSVRGCIVGPDLSALNLVLVKKGAEDIPGLTDVRHPRRIGPKRANNIRKLFNLGKDADVRKFVVRRPIEGTKRTKAPKIQRLITSTRIQRKRRYLQSVEQRQTASREAFQQYKSMLAEYKVQKNEKKAAELAKKTAKKSATAARASATKSA